MKRDNTSHIIYRIMITLLFIITVIEKRSGGTTQDLVYSIFILLVIGLLYMGSCFKEQK
jgi:hypothetical protein